MRVLLSTVLFLISSPTSAADPPEEKVPPHALLTYTPGAIPDEWISTFQLTTASGACYEVRLNCSNQFNFEQTTMTVLLSANWMVEQEFDSSSFRVYGTRTEGGELDAARSVTLVNRLVKGKGAMPQLRSVDGVKVMMNTDDGTPKSVGALKPRPTGPKLREESYVEFDISTLPAAGPDEPHWQSSWGVSFRAGDPAADCTVYTDINPTKPWEVLADVHESFSSMSCKAVIIGKTRLRVYGKVRNGRFDPALKGSVESDDLKPEELPRVTNARA